MLKFCGTSRLEVSLGSVSVVKFSQAVNLNLEILPELEMCAGINTHE